MPLTERVLIPLLADAEGIDMLLMVGSVFVLVFFLALGGASEARGIQTLPRMQGAS